MSSLTVLEARSLKSRCGQGCAPSEGSSFWGLHAFLTLWLHHFKLSFHLHVVLVCLHLPPSCHFCYNITSYWVWAHPKSRMTPSQESELCLHSVCARSLQSYLILCDPMDCNPPGSSVHGVLQARILEWDAMPFPRGSS